LCYDSTQVMYPSSEVWHMRYLDTTTCSRSWWRCDADSGDICMDSVIVPEPDSGYDYIVIDSVFDLWPILGDGKCFGEPTFPLPWGMSFIFQNKINTDMYDVVVLPAPDDSASHFVIPFPEDHQSITVIFTPATYIEAYHKYQYPFYTIDLGYFIEKNRNETDSTNANLPSAFLKPYPNPAVINEMEDQPLRFQFQVETDSLGSPLYGKDFSGADPLLVLDIFTISGERVITLSEDKDNAEDAYAGLYNIGWDMKNEAEKPVASGVYIVYARLYSAENQGEQLAEAHSKVAVIR